QAFKVIYHAFEKPAYTLAMRFCQNPDAARDILQESMLRVFRKIDQFRFEAPFWSWVRKIVVNAALMHLRSNKKYEGLEVLVDDMGQIDVDRPGTDRPALQRDLARAFAMLAPTRRAVLWLYAVEGYTHQEIAELVGKTPSFSKSQLMRARRQLKRWWALDREASAELLREDSTREKHDE
ncbi:MAG: sigma-70 family RNA polymerase sigma factor, partial [Porticoccaceae bacterium]|nr:sigma-70 family RNA polymerase sigma factor [Porticoccaceae bacterium]